VRGLGLASGVLLLLLVAGGAGWQMLRTYFVHRYHRETCEPEELSAGTVGSFPEQHHLENVPWIATREWYCQANSLAMVAAQHGMDVPTARCSFLMGFTYGASAVPGSVLVQFFAEPEAGLAVAAPYLGLRRRYTTTDDAKLFLDALRFHVSQGRAVRLGLDAAVLYGLEGQLPHSEVLVGYDDKGFRYYETVCLPEFRCEPGHRPPGEEGLWMSDAKLLAAVRSQSRMFSYPWRYSLTVFDKAQLQDDLKPIWMRNGRLLIGGAQYGPRQGADAIEELAANIEKRGPRVDALGVRTALEAAVFTRLDNAAYLPGAFSGEADVEQAAELLKRAGGHYADARMALGDGIADRAEADWIAANLRDAAAAEREVGEIFLARGR
jgi:hypothetical protein